MSLSCPMERCRGMESVVGIVLNADGPGLRTTPATDYARYLYAGVLRSCGANWQDDVKEALDL